MSGRHGLGFDGDGRLSVHAVLAGDLWCRTGGRTVHARQGEVVLLRGGQAFELLTHPQDRSVEAVVALVRSEIDGQGAGGTMVLDRLLDVLLVSCLRALWADQLRPPVWAGVPQDPSVGAALRAMHADPAHPWTVEELAGIAGLSRAALAKRFTAEVGAPPMTYLTQWRMGLARQSLSEDGATLAAVARQVGYASEYAFSAAFKREVGEAPGRWRARQGGGSPPLAAAH
jgi:AraC-like DNA-binding protein